jgi:hypothetical protein
MAIARQRERKPAVLERSVAAPQGQVEANGVEPVQRRFRRQMRFGFSRAHQVSGCRSLGGKHLLAKPGQRRARKRRPGGAAERSSRTAGLRVRLAHGRNAKRAKMDRARGLGARWILSAPSSLRLTYKVE